MAYFFLSLSLYFLSFVVVVVADFRFTSNRFGWYSWVLFSFNFREYCMYFKHGNRLRLWMSWAWFTSISNPSWNYEVYFDYLLTLIEKNSTKNQFASDTCCWINKETTNNETNGIKKHFKLMEMHCRMPLCIAIYFLVRSVETNKPHCIFMLSIKCKIIDFSVVFAVVFGSTSAKYLFCVFT